MKKLLVKRLKVKPHKIKPCGPKATYMFMNFANEVDREDAITKLDGYELKGKKLKAFKILFKRFFGHKNELFFSNELCVPNCVA